jgi:uncharacterized protein YukE
MRNEYSFALDNPYLSHEGIKGMKWGERRYQYEDGSLTPAGKIRYLKDYKAAEKKTKKAQKRYRKAESEMTSKSHELTDRFGKGTLYDHDPVQETWQKAANELNNAVSEQDRLAKILKDNGVDASITKVKDLKIR